MCTQGPGQRGLLELKAYAQGSTGDEASCILWQDANASWWAWFYPQSIPN